MRPPTSHGHYDTRHMTESDRLIVTVVDTEQRRSTASGDANLDLK